ncbi:MAG: hypothetical protein RR838_13530, partial [Clostridium sp.]
RNPHMNDASDYLSNNYVSEFVTTDFNKFKDNIDRIPWVVLSWGCEKKPILKELKKMWLEYIDSMDILTCGVLSNSSDNRDR